MKKDKSSSSGVPLVLILGAYGVRGVCRAVESVVDSVKVLYMSVKL